MQPDWVQFAQMCKNIGNVTIAQLDCQTNNVIAYSYQIPGYPSLVLFKNGIRVADYKSSRDSNSFMMFLKSYLNIA